MSRFRARGERGASAVEFALVMLPLLMIVFGVIQYSFYFWSMQGGADAARTAARLAATGQPSTTNAAGVTSQPCTDFVAAVRNQLSAQGIATNASTATVKRVYTRATAGVVTAGDKVQVTVTFRSHDFNLPFVPFINNGTVKSTANARVDYPNGTAADC